MLYQGGNQTAANRQGTVTNVTEIDRLKKKIEELSSQERTRKYLGLTNQGATCYMNSALQTLFMTPEFRRSVFQWTYNEDIHGDKEYCIPF